MKQHELFELTYSAATPVGSQTDINLQAVFTCGESRICVKGFYAGNGTYKIRFLPETVGSWHYEVTGIVTDCGDVVCEPSQGHGMVKAVGNHFEHADGQIFRPFGTTVYALAHQDMALIDQTLETLKNAPFNKVRMCVFPKHYDYNHNEPPFFAFEKNEDGSWNVHKPCFDFWDHLEQRITQLGEMGIQVDLILFHAYDRWGFDGMGHQNDLVYLDYLIRRLAAFPHIWWSLANEYDITKRTMEQWYDIEEFVAKNDPFGHLLSNHNMIAVWDASRPNITHASIQSKQLTHIGAWMQQFGKPIVIDECCYEGNLQHFWGSISGREMTRRFWRCVASGAYCTHGETLLGDENDILWWARGGALKGSSPERIRFLRQIAESLPGPLERIDSFWDKARGLAKLSPEEQKQRLGPQAETNSFLRAILNGGADLETLIETEAYWSSHCGEDCYLTYYDLRTCRLDTLELPETRKYRIELLNAWDMTREVIAENVSGKIQLQLPEREDMAILATAM